MITLQCLLRTLAAFAVSLGATSLAGAAQNPPEPPLGPPLGPGAGGEHEAIHTEMDQLFKQIELGLRDIDRQLFDAGAGKPPKEPVTDAGIARLLQDARDGGLGVKRDIERLLELAGSHVHAGGT